MAVTGRRDTTGKTTLPAVIKKRKTRRTPEEIEEACKRADELISRGAGKTAALKEVGVSFWLYDHRHGGTNLMSATDGQEPQIIKKDIIFVHAGFIQDSMRALKMGPLEFANKLGMTNPEPLLKYIKKNMAPLTLRVAVSGLLAESKLVSGGIGYVAKKSLKVIVCRVPEAHIAHIKGQVEYFGGIIHYNEGAE